MRLSFRHEIVTPGGYTDSHMKRILGLIGFLLSVLSGVASATPIRPNPAISHVLIVSVDGLRPDLVLLADAPTLRALLKRGSYTLWARTTDMAVTLPSHASMLTGVSPKKHGVTWNSAQPAERMIYSKWPTLFELARDAGYSTAMAAGKSKFSTLAKPGTLTRVFVPTDDIVSGTVVADHVVEWIQEDVPQVLFIHFAGPDATGHSRGWGSPEQL